MKDDSAKKLRLSFCKNDIVAVAVILLAALGVLLAFNSFVADSGSGTAVITKDGKVLYEIRLDELDEPMRIEVDGGYHQVIVAENGRIHVESSDCPGQSCVHTGWIDSSGKSIICLPNRLEIRITGESDIDAVVG